MQLTSTLDACLKRATDSGDVPGVVALVADRTGVIYEGASGLRAQGGSAAMTLDTFCWFASMTKAVTAAAAMQLVERGRLDLDAPAGTVCPELGALQVREGWDASGRPILRAPKRPVTLRNLLTHTSGFAYEIWNADVARELEAGGKPNVISGMKATLDRALICDPDSAWHYGVGIDWAGRMVEQASGMGLAEYLQKNLFGPLGMRDITFRPNAEQRSRAATMHARLPEGTLRGIPFGIPPEAELDMGGHALQGSLPSYLPFLRMILGGGVLDGVRVLDAKTVALMGQNQIGDIDVSALKTVAPTLSNDADFYPGMRCKWGLSFLINTQRSPEGRSAGSLSWAGLANSYYWIDPGRGLTGVLLTQIMPFFDAPAVALFRAFETAVNAACRPVD